MKNQRKLRVEYQKNRPFVRVVVNIVPLLYLNVAMDAKRYVFNHNQKIRNSEARKDVIGRPSHVLRREDADVKDIGNRPEDTDEQTQIAMHILVSVEETRQVAVRVIPVRDVIHFWCFVN